jgi:hypothetical protein
LVLRPSFGWRPFRDYGFEVMGGYTLALLGGSVSGLSLIEAGAPFDHVARPRQGVDVEDSSEVQAIRTALRFLRLAACRF